MHIRIYTSSYCGYCHKAKALLTSLHLPFEEINLDHQPIERAALQKTHHWYTVPLIFIDDTFIGGCDDLFVLYEKGLFQ